WDVGTGLELARLAGPQGEVTALAWDPRGTRLAGTGRDGIVRIWDGSTGRELATLEPADETPGSPFTFSWNALAWHPDGPRVASSGDDSRVRFWDAAGGAELPPLDESGELRIFALAWSP